MNSFGKATTTLPPLYLTPSPLYAEASFCPQKQNNVKEYFQTDAKLSLLHLNVKAIPQVSSTPDWKSVVVKLGIVSCAIIYISWWKKGFDQKVT